MVNELTLIIDINGEWAPIDIQDVDIVLHKAFADLDNPADIEAAYTLNCQLPFTEHNNDVLGHLYGLDFSNVSNLTFKQKERHKFKLLHGEAILYEGDFVMDSISTSPDAKSNAYNVTLYDEKYSIFKKLDYAISDVDTQEKTVNIDAINVPLTGQLVADTQLANYWVKNIDSNHRVNQYTNNDVKEIIGFLPTYKDTDVDTSTFTVINERGTALLTFPDPDDSNSTVQYEESEWDNLRYIAPRRAQFKDYPEPSMREWKTYDCKPYIKYHNYLDFIFAEIYRATGYVVNDGGFMSMGNKYYTDTLRTCKYIENDVNDLIVADGHLSVADPRYDISTWRGIQGPYDTDDASQHYIYTHTFALNEPMNTNYLYATNVSGMINHFIQNDWWVGVLGNEKIRMAKKSLIAYRFTFRFKSNGSYISACPPSETTVVIDPYDNANDLGVVADVVIHPEEYKYKMHGLSTSDYFSYPSTENVTYSLLNTSEGIIFNPKISGGRTNNDCYNYYQMNDFTATKSLSDYIVQQAVYGNADEVECKVSFQLVGLVSGHKIFEYAIQTGSDPDTFYSCINNTFATITKYDKPSVTYTNLLGGDFNILNAFTEFLKTFNLVCDVDYEHKEMNIYTRGQYFEKYGDLRVKDWTKYLKFDKGISATEIVSDYKNINYTYEERELPVNDIYKTTTGNQKGEYKAETNIDLNDEEYTFLEGQNNAQFGSYTQMSGGETNGAANLPQLYNRECGADDSNVNVYGIYWDTDKYGEGLDEVAGQLFVETYPESGRTPVTIYKTSNGFQPMNWFVEDCAYELLNESQFLPYLWTGCYSSYSGFSGAVSFERAFNHSNGEIETLWHKEDSNEGIFDYFHKNWHNLLYNKQSRYITAYLHIPLEEYVKFEFCDLITIEDCIYMVMSIEEYAFNNQIMQCQLLRLNDIQAIANLDAYQIDDDYLIVTPRYFTLPPSHAALSTGGTFTVLTNDTNLSVSSLNTPLWLNTFTQTQTGTNTYQIHYKTNSSNYPAYQDIWYNAIKVSGLTNGMQEIVCVTNTPEQTPVENPFSVTPTTVTVPNDTNPNSVNVVVTTTSSNVSFSLITTGSTVITGFRETYVSGSTNANNINIKYITYTLSFNDTMGAQGETQRLRVYNSMGQEAFITFVRGGLAHKHVEVITNDYSADISTHWDWDWVDEELAEGCSRDSVFSFHITTNYDFSITNWDKSLYDANVDEYAYNAKCYVPELWDVTDPANPTQYYPDAQQGSVFTGVAGVRYDLKFKYSRRYPSNVGTFAGFVHIECINGSHSTDPYNKNIPVSADVYNGGASQSI